MTTCRQHLSPSLVTCNKSEQHEVEVYLAQNMTASRKIHVVCKTTRTKPPSSGVGLFSSCFQSSLGYDERRSTITTSPPLLSKHIPELKRKRLAAVRERGERKASKKSIKASFQLPLIRQTDRHHANSILIRCNLAKMAQEESNFLAER
jgi:hypothetical protein